MMSATSRRLLSLVGLLVAVGVVLGVTWTRAEAAPPTLIVGSASADEGQTALVSITLSDATAGLAGFDLLVTLSDPTVANGVSVDFPNFATRLTRQTLNSAAEIRVSAVDLSD